MRPPGGDENSESASGLSAKDLEGIESFIKDVNTRKIFDQFWTLFTETLKELDIRLKHQRDIHRQKVATLSQLLDKKNDRDVQSAVALLHRRELYVHHEARKKLLKLLETTELMEELFFSLHVNQKVRDELDLLTTVLKAFLEKAKLIDLRHEEEKKLMMSWDDHVIRSIIMAMKDEALQDDRTVTSLDISHVRRMKEAYTAVRKALESVNDRDTLFKASSIMSKDGTTVLTRHIDVPSGTHRPMIFPYLFSSVFMILVYVTIEHLLTHAQAMRAINTQLMAL
ncbi:MAG: hypothetical protein ABIC95_00220 [archaeon]